MTHLELRRNALKNRGRGGGAAFAVCVLKRWQAVGGTRRADVKHAAAKSVEELGVGSLHVSSMSFKRGGGASGREKNWFFCAYLNEKYKMH